MQEITLTLSIEEVNGILQVLGDLPTKTGAYVLLTKIKQQAEAQIASSSPDVSAPTN